MPENAEILKLKDEIKGLKEEIQHLNILKKHVSSLFDFSDAVFFKWKNNENWDIEYVSKNVQNIFGYSYHEFITHTINYVSCIHPDDLLQVQEEVQNAIQTKATVIKHKPYKIIDKSQNIKIVLDNTILMYDNNQNLISFLGYVIDITEQYSLTAKYELQNSRLQTLLDAIPDLVWFKDTNGHYLSCNKKFEAFSGFSQNNVIDKTDYDLFSYEEASQFSSYDKKALESSSIKINYEEVIFKSDGHKEYLETIKTAVKDSSGNILGVLGIGRDITYIKEQTQELIEQKQEFQTIFENAKDGIAIIDLQTNFIRVNDAYCEMTTLCKEDLLNTNCYALALPEDLEKSKSLINSVIRYGYVRNFEKTCMINGRKITVNMTLTLLPDHKHILVNAKDITQYKLFEQQSKLAAMGEMIGNIAHQWRQPLSVITTIASSIKLRDEFDNWEDYNLLADMDSIVKQAKYLSKTIDDFRNFIKDSDNKEEFAVISTLQATLSILNASLIANNIQVHTSFSFDTLLFGNQSELMQCFINIINNAKDALKENVENDDEKHIFISTKRNDEFLELEIVDSAGGIPPSIMPKIFEPYFTTKHQSTGTGLGLSIAYQIITQKYNGKIIASNKHKTINNQTFKGACFTFFIDLKSKIL